MNKDNQGNEMHTVRPHTEDEIYDLLKQALDAMRLHTAETHPLVETERAMEAVEAKLAQPAQEPIRREQRLFMEEQAFYESPTQRQPLTDEEIEALADRHLDVGDGERHHHFVTGDIDFARAIEAAHGIKEQP